MRLLICAGGTGGGVYPALAVLQALLKGRVPLEGLYPPLEGPPDLVNGSEEASPSVLWVGGLGGMEADLVKRARVPFEAIPAAGLHGVGLRALPGNVLQLARGYQQARRILKRYQPDVLFFTGGFVAAPVAMAGKGLFRERSIPTLLYVPDIEPGLALKFLARLADCIAVNTEASYQYFSDRTKVTVTGYPTRPELHAWDVESARRAFGLSDHLPTLLVFGGSKGARSINRTLLPVLPDLLPEMQIIHITGVLDWSEVEEARANLHPSNAIADRYKAFPYLHDEMGAALAAADLVVSRAGASCLGEFPLFGLPAILVPYPHAWRYQQVNAQYLAERGAAVVLDDKDLAERFLPLVRELMHDAARRASMRQAMIALARPEAAESISQLIHRLAAPSKGGSFGATTSGRERV